MPVLSTTGFRLVTSRLLLSLEERMYTNFHLFNLIRVGWAIFLDMGRASKLGADSGIKDDYLSNFGFGLRFASSKSKVSRTFHVVLAFPPTNKNDPSAESS